MNVIGVFDVDQPIGVVVDVGRRAGRIHDSLQITVLVIGIAGCSAGSVFDLDRLAIGIFRHARNYVLCRGHGDFTVEQIVSEIGGPVVAIGRSDQIRTRIVGVFRTRIGGNIEKGILCDNLPPGPIISELMRARRITAGVALGWPAKGVIFEILQERPGRAAVEQLLGRGDQTSAEEGVCADIIDAWRGQRCT